jgi:hypothetical protein
MKNKYTNPSLEGQIERAEIKLMRACKNDWNKYIIKWSKKLKDFYLKYNEDYLEFKLQNNNQDNSSIEKYRELKMKRLRLEKFIGGIALKRKST